MKNILVTGGCGFIGSNFILYMLEKHKDIKIVNLDKLTYAGNPANLIEIEDNDNYFFVRGDICNEKVILDIFENHNVNTVVHFAAESHVDRSILGPEEFIRTNVFGTFCLLEVCRKFWKDVSDKKFLHVSTDEVYGSLGETGLFTENTSYDPSSPYSASKASSDHIVRSYNRTFGLPINITNCSNNYGPYQFPEKLIPLVIDRIIDKKEIPVYGKGDNVRDWLFVKDHCKAIETVLVNASDGETYNVGGNNEITNIDIVRTLCDLVDEFTKSNNSQNLIKFVKDRPGHDKRYAIDASKIKNELDWSPEYNFKTGIRETVLWYINNRKWVENIKTGDYLKYFEDQYNERL
ncbi:MAG: dTDP-glucose 4,6-dehydratase [Candidatus Muirbacterium halophilum]|nr:dTDP-glucose 4,6-dehydratase [Candidatus Muirbacterium halophilum]